jgi:hypothetical protein
MLLHNPSQYDARKKEILLAADAKLHGKYSKRVRVITDTWNLTAFSPSVLGKLNSYYATRHLIAHDQGIDNADAPERSSTEDLAGRVSITEDKWKKLIADFSNVLLELDQRIVQNVVKDRGLPLAIYRILERDGPQELGDFGPKLANEWRLGHVSKAATRSAAISIGLKIKQINGNRYRVSR